MYKFFFQKVYLICILLRLVMISCNLSLKDKNNEQKEKLDQVYATMTNDDKQALLEEKFKESPFVNDTLYESGSLTYLPTDTGDKLYCCIKHDRYEFCILQYNRNLGTWNLMIPREQSEYDDEPVFKYYSLQDFRLIGSHIYCKFFTGQCGLGLQAIAFECLDLNNEEWHFITYGTEASEFDGDRIKADIAWIVKEGENAWETECADSIRWIKME